MKKRLFLKSIKQFRIKKIFTKNFLIIILLIMVSVVINSLNFYFKINDAVINEISNNTIYSISRVKDVCDSILKSTEILATNMNIQDHVLFYTITDDEDTYKKYELEINKTARMYTFVQDYLDSIYIYSKSCNRIVSNREIAPSDMFKDIGWLDSPRAPDAPVTLISRLKDNVYPRLITVIRDITYGDVIGDESANNIITGTIAVNINAKKLGQMINTAKLENLFILDSKGEIIYSTNEPDSMLSETAVAKEFFHKPTGYTDTINLNGSAMIISVLDSNYYGMKYISLVPATNYSEMLGQTIKYTLENILFAVLIGLLITLIISYKTYQPIAYIKKMLASEAADENDVQITEGELQFIAKNISKSLTRNRQMEDELEKHLSALNKSTFATLQAQINPHFLYNTLENINWLAVKLTNSENKVSATILSLAKMLRYTLDNDGYLVSLEHEVEHTLQYIEILKIRYPDMFTVNWNINENILSYKTIRLLLQPLLENAIQHGIRPKDTFGTIDINGRLSDDNIIIEVIDDGRGMSEDAIRALNIQLEKQLISNSKNIGIKNINQRIKLVFGDKCGLAAARRTDGKTGLIIRLTFYAVNQNFEKPPFGNSENIT